MLAAIALFCLQYGYEGEVGAAIIFLEDVHYRSATALFKRQFAGTGVLKFSPKTIVLRRLKTDELREIDDIFLKPFFPLCNVSPEEIERQAPDWAREIKKAPGLKRETRKSLLGLLGGFISHKIRILDEEALKQLLGGFDMEEIPVIQEIFERKMQKESPKLIRKGMRHTILKMISTRFGKVP